MARAFTDENLRRDFGENPAKIAKDFNLSADDIKQIEKILPSEINFFADSLFYKRLNEVEKLLPYTHQHLNKEFSTYFHEFARDFQPKTVKKHPEDAVNFAGFLSNQIFEIDWINDLVIYEQSRLNFYGCRKSFIFKVFSYDIRKSGNAVPHRRKTFAVWLRIGKLTKHYIF